MEKIRTKGNDSRKQGIGELLFGMRKELDATQEQLCHGICSVSQIAKIENDELQPGFFLLDRIFYRLGKSAERLEYVLPIEIYELYEIRQKIQENICYGRLCEAEELLKAYERKKQADRNIHRQYILQEQAQIAWMRNSKPEEVLDLVERAISETMPQGNCIKKGMLLGADEIKLLLFRWEISQETEMKRGKEEIEEILFYLDGRKMEMMESVKVLPYGVLLLGKYAGDEKEYDILEGMTRKALSMLRETGKLLYMPEILEQYAELLAKRGGDLALQKRLQSERSSLLALEAERGISFEKFRLYEHVVRRFEVDYKLVKSTRIAGGLTQEELSEGICSQETLSRIENGYRSPSNKTLYEIMGKMNRKWNRVGTVIHTDDYELLEMKRAFCGEAHRWNYDKAEAILEEIEKKIDENMPENRLYLQCERIKLMYHKGEMDDVTCIKELKQLLKSTLGDTKGYVKTPRLTTEENNIVTEIAYIYYKMGDRESAIDLYRMQLQQIRESGIHPSFHILEWELAISNLATGLADVEQYEEAITLCEEKIKVSMEAGKGNSLGRSCITIAYALEQSKEESCIAYFERGLQLFALYKMEKRYQKMVKYVNSPEFPYKGRIHY